MISHLARMIGITAGILLIVFYPFLPGQYDSLALPISIVVQAGVAVGMILVPIGVLWLIYELRKKSQLRRNHKVKARRYYFALATAIAFSLAALVVSLVAFATVGFSLLLGSLIGWMLIFRTTIPKLKSMKDKENELFNPSPLYFVFVPLAVAILQVVLGTPITNFSRDNAITNSREYISDIEAYYAEHGSYPVSLLAMWKDYYPNVIGIEKYHYSPSENAYNLSFEQPKLLFDNIGTREWVVYNPRDEHQMFSHTSWSLLLTPSELQRSQGWYAVNDTTHPHWKSFWFD